MFSSEGDFETERTITGEFDEFRRGGIEVSHDCVVRSKTARPFVFVPGIVNSPPMYSKFPSTRRERTVPLSWGPCRPWIVAAVGSYTAMASDGMDDPGTKKEKFPPTMTTSADEDELVQKAPAKTAGAGAGTDAGSGGN